MANSPLDHLTRRTGLPATSVALTTALTHSSFAAEHGVDSNERLEFLGDAVVDLAIADLIYRDHPELDEGTGSLVRSRVVNESALAAAARQLELGALVRVGRGVRKERGLERPSLLADAFEAVVAAIFLERGFDAARDFVADSLADEVRLAAKAPGEIDPKTRLRQWAEAHELGAPSYALTSSGPAHAMVFVAEVVVAGRVLASAEGRSKKAAEIAAAHAALAAEVVSDA